VSANAGAVPLSEASGPSAALERALILATCTAVTFLYAMTVTIANVSLPQMQGALSATPDQIAWVVTSNLVATAVMTPLAGWLLARFGRRWLCCGAVAGFGAASLACGLADSLAELVFFRALQGAFGAPLVPVSQAIVLDTYARRRHGAVLAIYGMGSVLGPIVGPVAGGWLSETYDWRWVFYMIVPFALAALAGTLAFIRDRERAEPPRLDWLGFVLLSAGGRAAAPREAPRRGGAGGRSSAAPGAPAPTGSTRPRSSPGLRSPPSRSTPLPRTRSPPSGRSSIRGSSPTAISRSASCSCSSSACSTSRR
jgi:MFS family permease